MRRFVVIGFGMLLTVLIGCGGKKSTSTTINVPANLAITPSTLSLTAGGVASVSTTVTDVTNSVVTNPPTVTYSSNNTAIVNISPAGLVCAGIWDANFIVCTPGPSGNATITATAGTLTSTVPVFVHPRVDRVTISPTSVNCISMGTQQQLTAQAFSGGTDITSQVGPATWQVGSTTVVSIDSSGVANGLQPGITNVSATVAGVTSLPASFTVCPVARISVHVSGSTATNLTMATGTPATLVADVFDSKGVSIKPNLTWLNSQPVVASMSNGSVTPLIPGNTQFSAVCQPSNGCNVGLASTFGNLVTAVLPGTENPGLVVSSSSGTSLLPIDMSTGTPGTAITLPYSPNSMFINVLGQNVVMGSPSAIITFAVGGSSAATITQATGKILAANSTVDSYLTFDNSRSTLFVTGLNAGSASGTAAYSVTGATGAAYSPDNTRGYVVAGSSFSPVTGTSLGLPVLMAAPGNDVTFLASGQFIYIAGGAPSAVTVWSTYNNSLADTVNVPATPLNIRSLPDASQVLAVDNNEIDVITPSSSLVGTPPTVHDTLTAVLPFGVSLTPRKLIVSPDAAHAAVTSDQTNLMVYTKANGTITPIPIANGATCFSGGFSLDGGRLFLGCSDNAVHVFDMSQMLDVKQIGVSFTPDLAAIQAK